jgi:formylglycine-generating enzyme required for sulfatase activity
MVRLDVGPEIDLYRDAVAGMGDAELFSVWGVWRPALSLFAEGEHLKEWIPNAEASATSLAPTNIEGLVWLPAGEFVMGSPTEETGREADEGPPTRVTISQGFWIGKCEVTQGEYQRVMGTNPNNTTGDANRPVERVSWFEATEYCKKLTDSVEAAGRLPKGYVYRLPTEAEWEYACRAGTTTRFSYGEDKSGSELGDYAWFTRNSESTTHPVGTRRPNPWGLFDMHGNIWEWCLDRWEDSLPGGSITNSPVAAEGNLRAARGGSWLYDAKACRSANRDDYGPRNRCSDIGFRVVLAPP